MTLRLPLWLPVLLLGCSNSGTVDDESTGTSGETTSGTATVTGAEGSGTSVMPTAETTSETGTSGGSTGTETTGNASTGSGGVIDCADVSPPVAGILFWLAAGEGVELDGDRVVSWEDQAGGDPATPPDAGRRPVYLPDRLNGHPAIRFEDGEQVLQRDVPIDGRTELTIAFVNATPTLWKADEEWCQHEDCDPNKGIGPRPVTETGCSGTYQKVLWWDGTGDWTFVYLTPKQEEIAFRFGNGHKTYTDGTCDLSHDNQVSYLRPRSIGDAYTSTVAIHAPSTNSIHVHGELVSETPVPGGNPEIYAIDRLDIGNGFGWIDGTNHGGDVVEVLIYDRALAGDDLESLHEYLACRFFPR